MIGALASRLLSALQAVLLAVVVLALWLLATPAGSAWLVGTVAAGTDGMLDISGVHGSLLRGLQADRIEIRVTRTRVLISAAEVSVFWPDLLRSRLRLTTARAGEVLVEVGPRPPDQPDTPVMPLLLPVVIAADSLEVGQVQIRIEDREPVSLQGVRMQGELAEGTIHFSSVAARFADIELSAAGSFGTGEPFATHAELRWSVPGQALSGHGPLRGDLAALRFEQVVRLPDPLGVGGVLRLLADEPEIIAGARWRDVSRELGEGVTLVSDRGQLQLRGWTEGFTAELDTGVALGAWSKMQLTAAGSGDMRQLHIDSLRLSGPEGVVSGRGLFNYVAGLRGAFVLRGRGINPRPVDARLAGKIDFEGQLGFDPAGNYSFQLHEAQGTLFERQFRASGTVASAEVGQVFDGVQVRVGLNRLDIDGIWGPALSGQFSIDAPDLATLWPGLEGHLRGTGTISGTAAKPGFDLMLDGDDLAMDELRVDTLRARGGLGAGDTLDLKLVAAGLSVSGLPLGDLDVLASGALDDHELRIALSGGELTVGLEATGTLKQGSLLERFSQGFVMLSGTQHWKLQETAVLRLAGTDLGLSAHCWRQAAAELCLSDISSDARGTAGGLRLGRFPLASLATYLGAGVELAGTADAELDFRQHESKMTGTLRADLRDAAFIYRAGGDGDDITVPISEFTVEASATEALLSYSGRVSAGFGLSLAAGGVVTDPFGAAPEIRGTVSGGIPDLAPISPVLERFIDIGDISGRIELRAGLSGDARRPDISGGLELKDGALSLPVAGVTVDRITLAILGREDGAAVIKGGARSGKGHVGVDGTVLWRDRLLPGAEFAIKGRVFEVIDLPNARAEVSPNVRVVLDKRQFRVSGEVLVPRASIKLKAIGESAVQPSPDTVVHGRSQARVSQPPPLFVLDGLRVRLGEQVSFEGFGLKTRLTGGMSLSQGQVAGQAGISGEGVVQLAEGKFAAFGQKLDIDRGSLIFAGDVTDPGLDVKASRKLSYEGSDVTAGVLLSGTLSRIVTRVFSEPAMGEMDALSYLTTGRPLSAAGTGDQYSVANAAVSLGLSGALPVAQQLGSALKVDEIALDSTSTGGAAVVVGEKLGDDLYIRYSYGVFDNLGIVKVTYKIGRRLSIEASSGEEQALDLIYSINW
ncbi:MAG: translocation/assembly module TamB domain-containing protein [Gammaproteobacteria bacterium]|nr:translocation/assembly module TamB domain-containing protein [Gammaproteobacteria bacterium]